MASSYCHAWTGMLAAHCAEARRMLDYEEELLTSHDEDYDDDEGVCDATEL
ncbi:hypothetical protein [Marinobacter sp. X15-166B]|uniref:hypothetical protein n=1 Tax=Marinobacter sp. X15-166B TaxID=1897620 RepID=UPI001300FDA4|nr:hypothetical protein [Marinobacter sp. X15-166B]